MPEAIARFVTATANGASARIITSFGDLLARLGLREEAAERYREALRCGGTCEAHANLGLLAVDEGRCEEALAGFDRALKLDPASAEVRINRANVLVELGRLDEAAARVQRADRRPRRRRSGLVGTRRHRRRPRRLRGGDGRPRCARRADRPRARAALRHRTRRRLR